jgi:hypothetical protein
MKGQWNDKILSVQTADFEELALEIFRYQYANNTIYQQYTDALGIRPGEVKSLLQLPFLPIRFFKSHRVQTGSFEPQQVFESSGTTGSTGSLHFVKDADWYRRGFTTAFQQFYGDPADWCIIGLLPSYLERKNSSLVYMVDELVRQSGHSDSGFYLNEFDRLAMVLKQLEQQGQKTLLIGVTFGLLDFGETHSLPLRHTLIMETGGMKGRREELVRPQVHAILKESFGVNAVHSEYGMTELLSQAYSKGEGIFQSPGWMRVLLRDEEDPLTLTEARDKVVNGAINVIDLANIHSCCFIATDDAGRLYPDGSFEVLGRLDGSDLRGCSLLTV